MPSKVWTLWRMKSRMRMTWIPDPQEKGFLLVHLDPGPVA